MHKIATIASLGLASALTGGLLALQAPATADDVFAKRDDDTSDVVTTVDDEDDDDTGARDDDTDDDTTNTGISRSTNDGTNSRFTKVTRDRDASRSDLTRDMTRDGKGGPQRDLSANLTNDRSRNDTRR